MLREKGFSTLNLLHLLVFTSKITEITKFRPAISH